MPVKTIEFSAKSLPNKDLIWSDPYFKIYQIIIRGDGKLEYIKVFKSEVIKKTLYPNWDPLIFTSADSDVPKWIITQNNVKKFFTRPFELDGENTKFLIVVYDWDFVGKDDFIGQCIVSFDEMVNGEGSEEGFQLYKKDDDEMVTGKDREFSKIFFTEIFRNIESGPNTEEMIRLQEEVTQLNLIKRQQEEELIRIKIQQVELVQENTSEIDDLKKALADKERRLQISFAENEKMNELQRENDQLSKINSEQEDLIRKNLSEINDAKQERNDLLGEVDELSKIKIQQEELIEENMLEIEILKNNALIQEQQKQQMKTDAKIGNVITRWQRVQRTVMENNKNKKLQEEIQRLRINFSETLEQSKLEKNQLIKLNEDKQNQMRKMSEELESMKIKNSDFSMKIQECESTLAKELMSLTSMESELKLANEKYDRLMENHCDETNNLKNELDEKASLISNRNADLEKAKIRIADLEESKKTMHLQLNLMDDQLEQKKKELQNMKDDSIVFRTKLINHFP